MTDYLEPRLEGENALLDAWRRAQAALERLGTEGRAAGADWEEPSARPAAHPENTQPELTAGDAAREGEGPPPPGRGRAAGQPAQAPRHPLQAAVEHMERTGRAARGMEAAEEARRGRSRHAAPDVEKPGAPVRRAAGRPEQTGSLTAAQVDLAFRRDSRRYDGGFFLY